VAQNRDKWQAFVNMIMNLHVPYEAGDFLIRQVTLSFSINPLLHEESLFNK
jgi:hypothetical protein